MSKFSNESARETKRKVVESSRQSKLAARNIPRIAIGACSARMDSAEAFELGKHGHILPVTITKTGGIHVTVYAVSGEDRNICAIPLPFCVLTR